ncbi:MAG TPA: TlpA disulfide reductase family protein [bacterium]|nr:TlpA disulfide reductase family protein [bacterium]
MKRFCLLLNLVFLPLPLPLLLSAAKAPVAAPAFSVKDLSGTAWTQASQAQGVLLVDFWATWCPPCLREIPGLNALQAKYGPGHRLSVLGLCMDDGGAAAAKAGAAKFKIAYPVAPAGEALAQSFGVVGLPTAFVLKDGKILATLVGLHSPAEFEKDLAPFLK